MGKFAKPCNMGKIEPVLIVAFPLFLLFCVKFSFTVYACTIDATMLECIFLGKLIT